MIIDLRVVDHTQAAPLVPFPVKERFTPGCFDHSIRGPGTRPVALLWQHDTRSLPLGRSLEWHTTRHELLGRFHVRPGPVADSLARLLDHGGTIGVSVGFLTDAPPLVEPAPTRWNPDDATTWDTLLRTRCRLLEVSLTPTPMHPRCQVLRRVA